MIDKSYRWYVVYTKTQHEKKVHMDIEAQSIQSFLPLVKTVRFWSDRKKYIHVPMFPNYVFIKLSCREYYRILNHPSVISFVKFEGNPSSVPEEQINCIRKITEHKMECIFNYNIDPGQDVEITHGPLKGFKGNVVRLDKQNYVVIYLKQIRQSVYVKIDKDALLICN